MFEANTNQDYPPKEVVEQSRMSRHYPSKDKEIITGRRSKVRDLDNEEKFKTSTLGEIVSLEKLNKNVIGLRISTSYQSKLPLKLQLLRVYLVYKKETSRIEKLAEKVDFAEIVDFLNANPIRTQKQRKSKRKATKISQSSGPTTVVADETVYKERRDIVEKAATTTTSLDVEQDSGTINRTQSMAISNEPIHQGNGLGGSPRRQYTILGIDLVKLDCSGFGNYSSKEESQEIGKEEKVKNFTTQDDVIQSQDRDAKIQGSYGHDIEISTASTSINNTSINVTTNEPVTTVSTPITTAGVSVSTVEPSTPLTITTTIIKDEDLITSQTLIKIRSQKSKEKSKERGPKENSSETATRPTRGVIMREASETTTRPIVLPQQKLNPKDKEVTQRLQAQLQAELEEEERMARQKEEDANIAEWDDVQAMMDADRELAKRLQVEEQGEFSIKEKIKRLLSADEVIAASYEVTTADYGFYCCKIYSSGIIRCPVTILNTKDHLGKFDGKPDEGFFVGYSLNSKAFRVFNNRTRIVEENLHISDDGKKVDKDPRQESKCKDQEKEDNMNSTNNVNVVGTNGVNDVDDDEMANMNNLDTTIQVSPIPTTRIHKDHPIDQVIGDLHSTS
nr:retrovirus-related Pol polyprotein from transposon TNT 1-94 [Tanacetum cinerariifolium]